MHFTRIWYHLYPKVTGNLNTLLDWLILQAILTIYREGNLDQVSHKSASFSEFQILDFLSFEDSYKAEKNTLGARGSEYERHHHFRTYVHLSYL